MRTRIRILLLAVLVLCARPAAAQPGWDTPRREPTRAELEQQLARAAAAAANVALGDELRQRAGNEAELLRVRLRDGDLQPGDQVALQVEGEQALTATFTVTPGRELVLPGMDPLALDGVLRTELQDRVRAHVARYLRDPSVRAQSMVRVAVFGHVRSPGYYAVPAESMVSDVIMAAGGPLPSGRVAAATVERGGTRIWAGRSLQDAVQYGLTLDQMSLRSGDQIVIPEQPAGRTATLLRVAAAVPAAVLAVLGVARLF